MQPADQPARYYRYHHAEWEAMDAGVISETPVQLTVNGASWLTFLCSPTRLEELAVGFLFNEGLIQAVEEVASVRACDNGGNVDVWLRHAVEKPQNWRRTSGCTGGATRADAPAPAVDLGSQAPLAPEAIFQAMAQLIQGQELYRAVRGVHCSGMSDGEAIRVRAEDIGRHNTLDKIAGILLLERVQMERRMVITTGRISSEMLQKSARLGAQIVVSRTSPTSLSIRLAEELGITLVGYARQTQFNVYTYPQRLGYSPQPVAVPVRESARSD